MTIKEVLKKYYNIEIELLLAGVLKKPKEFLFLNPEYKLTTKQLNNLTKLIERRKKGEPIAYILGYKDFYGLRFKVNKNVLVPRPETEYMVDKILSTLSGFDLSLPSPRQGRDKKGRPETEVLVERAAQQIKDLRFKSKENTIKILDIGTGSGCIIISLAKSLYPHPALSHRERVAGLSSEALVKGGGRVRVEFCASDVSKKALAVAKQNAKYHRVKIKFYQSNLLKNIKGDFDIIVANLPYGWQAWKNNSSTETIGIKFEPKQALFTKNDGLYLIEQLLKQIKQKKNKPQLVYLEFDPRQKRKLENLIKKYFSKSKLKFYRDFANLWRLVEVCI